jgi:hypothetical protein
VSNSDTSLTRSLYRNFTRHRITQSAAWAWLPVMVNLQQKSSPQNQQAGLG